MNLLTDDVKDTRRAWVFAGGDFTVDHLPVHEVEEQDLIVCVDRGLLHCLSSGLQPHMLIGDMDSAPESLLQDQRIANVKRYIYPSKKASSDLELALNILIDESVHAVVLLGVSGGRTDHMLFNWQLIRLRLWPFSMRFIDETTDTYVLKGCASVNLGSQPGAFLSLLAMESCTGVSTDGLQYRLNAADVDAGSTLGLSNVVVAERVRIEIASGVLLVMVQRNEQGIQ